MKTRRSLDTSKQTLRKQSKRFSLDSYNLNNSKVEEQKENISAEEIKSNFLVKEDNIKPTKRRKTRKGQSYREWDLSLQANNRALATALEEAHVRINAKNQENVYLKKQLHCERQFYIERIGKEVEQKVQYQFKAIEDCLQDTISKLLESSKLISSAIDMVSQPSITTAVTPVSCFVPAHSLDTTPPPDVPDFLEMTNAELAPMETTSTELGNIDIIEMSLDTSQGPKITKQLSVEEQMDLKDDLNDTDIHVSQTKSSLENSMRGKRKRSSNVSYVMPSLRSKLRRGDPFTDPFFKETFCYTKSKRKGRMSTGCIQKKARHALSNLTNIITEEQEPA